MPRCWFQSAVADVGYAEGRNVAIEYRFTDGRYDPLSAQLTDLTQRKVGVIVFVGPFTEELLQQVRTSPTPIVFVTGSDPVREGQPRFCTEYFNPRREDAVLGRLQGSQSGPARRQDTRSYDTCSHPHQRGLRPTIPEQNGRCSDI